MKKIHKSNNICQAQSSQQKDVQPSNKGQVV